MSKDADTKAAPPHSWFTILAGIAFVLTLAVSSIILTAQYLRSRPVDLTAHSAALADHVDKLLVASRVPEQGVERDDGEPKEDDTAFWTTYTFDVSLPDTLSAKGVAKFIKNDMARRNVAVAESSAENAEITELRLEITGHEFALIRLAGGSERSDLTQACLDLADKVKAGLQAAGVTSPVEQVESEARKDGAIRWASFRLRADLAQDKTADDVVAALGQMLRDDEVDISLSHGEGGESTVVVAKDGLNWVTLVLAGQAPDPGAVPLPFVQMPELNGLGKVDLLGAPETDTPDMEGIRLESTDTPGAPPAANPGDQNPDKGVPADKPARAQQSDDANDPSRTGKQPRVAVIVDDGGYGGAITEAILALDPRLTLAILPNARFTTETARRASEKGFEIILHMPMESDNGNVKFPGNITTSMTGEEIAKLTVEALDQLPGVVGVNNHTGSKFTADDAAMKAFLEVLKGRSLYFVDSRTTAKSTACEIANDMCVPTASRDVFLDNQDDPDRIRADFDRLLKHAKSDGAAIGICHFRSSTAEVLAEVLPKIGENGILLVHASELVG